MASDLTSHHKIPASPRVQKRNWYGLQYFAYRDLIMIPCINPAAKATLT